MNPLASLDLTYVCADRGISLRGTKGAANHVRELASALAARTRRFRLCVARDDGPEPAPDVARATLAELAADPPADVVLERWSLGSDLGVALADAAGAEFWLEIDAPLVDEALAHRGLAAGDAERERALFARLARRADLLLAVSPALVDHAIAHSAPRRRTLLLPNAFASERFCDLPPRAATRQRHGLRDDAFTLVFAGGFRPWHDLPTLIAGFARLREEAPDARLVLAGEGPTRAGLDRAALAALEVRDLGHVPARELPALLAAADVGVSPNRADAGDWFCPLKIREYQAAGLAVVASADAGANAAVVDGTTGLLVPPGDVDALVRALRRLRDDPALLWRIAAAGRADAFARATYERQLDRIDAFRGAVLAQGTSS